jgi:bacillithiol system protein YtxJ
MRESTTERDTTGFVPVASAEAIEALFAASHQRPVVLFKHDPFCGTSMEAREELLDLGHEVALLDVARHHELGQTVARLTGVRHESPQAFVLKAGRPVWSGSHWKITAEAVRNALAEA